MHRFLLIILCLVASTYGYTQQKAFPTAYGAAGYVTGGRGYPVYHVTNLSSSTITGSFTQAIADAKSGGGGNIVFDVSGTI